MPSRWGWAGGAAVVLAGLATWAVVTRFVPSAAPAAVDTPPDQPAGRGPPREPPTSPSSGPSSEVSLPVFAPSRAVSRGRGTSARPPDNPASSLAALDGLALATIDDGVRERLRVPRSDQIGRGVLVTGVHPDSPGAEIALQPQDVIVRAQRQPVDDLSDLENIVRGRDHTLLIVARNGRLYEMVIKPPFKP